MHTGNLDMEMCTCGITFLVLPVVLSDYDQSIIQHCICHLCKRIQKIDTRETRNVQLKSRWTPTAKRERNRPRDKDSTNAFQEKQKDGNMEKSKILRQINNAYS